jgi:hypothetical protein
VTKGNVINLSQFALKQLNRDVISKIRQTGLFQTNEAVIDAALRLLVDKLKQEFDTAPPAPAEAPSAIKMAVDEALAELKPIEGFPGTSLKA